MENYKVVKSMGLDAVLTLEMTVEIGRDNEMNLEKMQVDLCKIFHLAFESLCFVVYPSSQYQPEKHGL